MPRIRSWRDYPEFLERFERVLGMTAEEIMAMTVDELREAWREFGIPDPTEAQRETINMMTHYARAEGWENQRVEFIEKIDRHIWRDLETGRFIKSPFAD